MHQHNFYCISSRVESAGQLYGCFKIGPFWKHQSLTFANSLRRTLLAENPRCVFDAVQIQHVEHEFSNVVGLRESVLDLILNLEKLKFQVVKPITKPQTAFVHFCGPGILRAQHIHLPPMFKCVNPYQYIATLEVDGQLTFKLFFPPNWNQLHPFRFFKNVLPSQKHILPQFNENTQKFTTHHNQQLLFVKSSTNAIERVNYTLQGGAKEFILLEIWTDGSVHPQKAIFKAFHQQLLAIYPYSFQIVPNLHIKPGQMQRKQITNISKTYFREKFLNLELSNFFFKVETLNFLRGQNVFRISDFDKINLEDCPAKIYETIVHFQMFIKRVLYN